MDQRTSSSTRPPPEPPGAGWDRQVTIPGNAFVALAAGLRGSGPSGTEALREAGRAAGEELYGALRGRGTPEGADLPPGEFWERTRRFTAPAGLGRPRYAVLAPGVGSVVLDDGAEAARTDAAGACHFAAGWIGGLLSRAAGEPVAVLEVRCAALGPGDRCRFLVGSAGRLREIRRRLSRGSSLFRAVGGRAAGPPPSAEGG